MSGERKQEWQTPKSLFEWIQSELGVRFTLDPCTDTGNWLGTPKFYTVENDGLRQDWSGETVFMNPPYDDLAPWLEKAFRSSLMRKFVGPNPKCEICHGSSGRGGWGCNCISRKTLVVGLLPVRTSPAHMRQWIFRTDAVFLPTLNGARDMKSRIGFYFFPRRVTFIVPETGMPYKKGNYFDSMAVVWR